MQQQAALGVGGAITHGTIAGHVRRCTQVFLRAYALQPAGSIRMHAVADFDEQN